MSRFNTLLHGEPRDVIVALEDEPADEQELRAALQNAFRMIETLHARIERMDRTLKSHLDNAV
jgi:hypothetical protein